MRSLARLDLCALPARVLGALLPRMPGPAFRQRALGALFRWYRWRDERG